MDDDIERPLKLKLDLLGCWIESEWMPRFPDQTLKTLWSGRACVHHVALDKIDREHVLHDGFCFEGFARLQEASLAQVIRLDYRNELGFQSGGYVYRFVNKERDESAEILVLSAFPTDSHGYDVIVLASVPEAHTELWKEFSRHCQHVVNAMEPSEEVTIIGGHAKSFVPNVEWDEIVLPEELKSAILDDVQSFFDKGVAVYRRMKLKPFRKLLLAGVPGTGKTMLCSALAKWAIEQKFLVIYISSADRDGATFEKIEQALDIAADSKQPTIILLEELDAYIQKKEEKSLVLNVLDGSESAINDEGTLLIATTNYPEAIDERIIKRPGRLDRIFIVPETTSEAEAERMLRQYLADMWQDDHVALVPELVGYPGAFIREVAIYALTQAAYDDREILSLELLESSYNRLREQIDERDEFLKRRNGFGLLAGEGVF
jgi:SpoVK/Ycf46/Vps4 family AAA+-type ATPase